MAKASHLHRTTRRSSVIGQRFGRLVVIAQAESAKYTRWVCQCDCGATKVVSWQLLAMGENGTRSCGCFGKEQRRAARWSQLARERARQAGVPARFDANALEQAMRHVGTSSQPQP